MTKNVSIGLCKFHEYFLRSGDNVKESDWWQALADFPVSFAPDNWRGLCISISRDVM